MGDRDAYLRRTEICAYWEVAVAYANRCARLSGYRYRVRASLGRPGYWLVAKILPSQKVEL